MTVKQVKLQNRMCSLKPTENLAHAEMHAVYSTERKNSKLINIAQFFLLIAKITLKLFQQERILIPLQNNLRILLKIHWILLWRTLVVI